MYKRKLFIKYPFNANLSASRLSSYEVLFLSSVYSLACAVRKLTINLSNFSMRY